jgi:hypothetical protein
MEPPASRPSGPFCAPGYIRHVHFRGVILYLPDLPGSLCHPRRVRVVRFLSPPHDPADAAGPIPGATGSPQVGMKHPPSEADSPPDRPGRMLSTASPRQASSTIDPTPDHTWNTIAGFSRPAGSTLHGT